MNFYPHPRTHINGNGRGLAKLGLALARRGDEEVREMGRFGVELILVLFSVFMLLGTIIT